MDNPQPTFALIEWLAGLAFTISLGIVGHIHRRVSAVEAALRKAEDEVTTRIDALAQRESMARDDVRKETAELVQNILKRLDDTPTKQDLQDCVRSLRMNRS